MGERIKDINDFKIGNNSVRIELNQAYTDTYKYDIHLHTDHVQFSMRDGDFIKFAAILRKAKTEIERKDYVKSSD